MRNYLQAIENPEVRVFRYEGALMFASFPYFRHKLIEKTSVDPITRRKLLKTAASNQSTDCSITMTSSSVNETVRIRLNDQVGDSNGSKAHNPEDFGEEAAESKSSGISAPLLVQHIVLDCSVWSFIDDTALTQLIEALIHMN